jgi:predicted GIY-YIG superfamily endonuclease
VAFVYILRCADGSLYTGSAKDVMARLRLHQAGRAARYTRGRRPVMLLWTCECASWGEALREEHRIKRLRRRLKEALVQGPGKPPVRRAGTHSRRA